MRQREEPDALARETKCLDCDRPTWIRTGPHLLGGSLCLALGTEAAVGAAQLLVLEEGRQAVLLDRIAEGNVGQLGFFHVHHIRVFRTAGSGRCIDTPQLSQNS